MRRARTEAWLSLLVTVNFAAAFSPPALAGRISLPDAAIRHTLIGKTLRCSPARTPALRELAGLRGGSGLSAIARHPAHGDSDPSAIHEDYTRSEKIWRALYAAAAVAATGGLAFSIEQGGTYVILSYLKSAVGASSYQELLGFLMAWAQDASVGGLALSVGACTVLQILPVFNGILLAMAMGAMWGTGKGLACASMGATAAALFAALTSRYVLKDLMASPSSSSRLKPPAIIDAVASSISESQRRSLALIALFRLSPVIPFVWSNYLLGLTPVKVVPYTVGTWLGTLPSLAVFVSAGVVGKAVVAGSTAPPPGLLVAGGVATFGVLAIIGRISQQELAKQAGQGAEVQEEA